MYFNPEDFMIAWAEFHAHHISHHPDGTSEATTCASCWIYEHTSRIHAEHLKSHGSTVPSGFV